VSLRQAFYKGVYERVLGGRKDKEQKGAQVHGPLVVADVFSQLVLVRRGCSQV
jgi:cytochrome oxidase assembly protein ShyY1